LNATHFSLTPKDSAARSALGLGIAAEVKIISAFFENEEGFTIHDAFYLDLFFGQLYNPRERFIRNSNEKEQKWALAGESGYLAMAGYRNDKWGVLGGFDFRYKLAMVGDVGTGIVGTSVLLRGEYNFSNENERRLVTTFWLGNYKSIRAELSLGQEGEYWIFGQYEYFKANGEDLFYGIEKTEMDFNQFTIGIKRGFLP
jgi:hypothetical protein